MDSKSHVNTYFSEVSSLPKLQRALVDKSLSMIASTFGTTAVGSLSHLHELSKVINTQRGTQEGYFA
eukprot:6474746-Amphidinium_carterae.1